MNFVRRSQRSAWLAAGVALALAWVVGVSPTRAQDDTPPAGHFTIIVSSAFARSKPDEGSERMFSVFSGESYPVIERSADERWVHISNWRTLTGWLPAESGLWRPDGPATEAELAEALAERAAAIPRPAPGVVPSFSPEALAVYRRGIALGNNPDVFAKIGDCNSENGRFLVMFDQPGQYTLGDRYAHLQHTIDYYAGSWDRTSLAANSGFSPASVMDPIFADPGLCQDDEGPLLCEYRLIRPSVAIIALGTHYAPTMAQYEADLRVVIEESMRLGVVPILATKADDVEGGDRINPIIRRLAEEYQMPLWDYWLAAQPLPNGGLNVDGIHPSYAAPIFDDPWSMQQGWPWRNLTAVLALDALRQATTEQMGKPGVR